VVKSILLSRISRRARRLCAAHMAFGFRVVSMCTFVLVKQVSRRPQRNGPALLYLC
jgi:hypothetical protein